MWSLNPPGVGVVQEQEKNKEEEQQKNKHDGKLRCTLWHSHNQRNQRKDIIGLHSEQWALYRAIIQTKTLVNTFKVTFMWLCFLHSNDGWLIFGEAFEWMQRNGWVVSKLGKTSLLLLAWQQDLPACWRRLVAIKGPRPVLGIDCHQLVLQVYKYASWSFLLQPCYLQLRQQYGCQWTKYILCIHTP